MGSQGPETSCLGLQERSTVTILKKKLFEFLAMHQSLVNSAIFGELYKEGLEPNAGKG